MVGDVEEGDCCFSIVVSLFRACCFVVDPADRGFDSTTVDFCLAGVLEGSERSVGAVRIDLRDTLGDVSGVGRLRSATDLAVAFTGAFFVTIEED